MDNRLLSGTPIWVYYQDIDTGSNLRVPHLVKGYQGQNYSVTCPKFNNYKFIKNDGKLKGCFNGQQENVHLYYRKKNWGEIEEIDKYIHLTATTQQYDSVNGMPIDMPLPGDSYVRSFERIATMDGAFWYEINADRWIKFDVNTMKFSDKDPFENIDTKQPTVTELRVLPLNNVTGVVDYLKGGHLYTYNQPYGEPTGTIANGQDITLKGRLEDENGVTWYQTTKDDFINGAYVKVLEDKE